MSKIGRKPIEIKDTEVTIKGQEVHFKGKKASGVFVLPQEFVISVEDKKVRIMPRDKNVSRETKMLWGTHRALLADKIQGASTPFEKIIQINGLGFKASVAGKKVDFILGFTHKNTLDVPEGVTVEIDKTGQTVTLRGSDKEQLGAFADEVRSLRPPEPYKGKGIKLSTETIRRKAGKAKAAA